jgi:uncharacterized iron-regulated membrane protein
LNIQPRLQQATVDPARTRRKQSANRMMYEVHSWLGTITGLLLFIICWSGTFATVSHELDWLANASMRVVPDGHPAADLHEIHDVVAAAMPGTTISSVSHPLYERFAADVVIETATGELRHVYVDPYALRITGSTAYFNNQRFFRDFHMNFFTLLGVGKYVVTLFAFPLIASLATALIFYKRWWRRFFSVRTDRGAKALWSSLHKAAGLWSLWFVLLIGITSVWYLFEAVRSDAIDGKFSYADTAPSAVIALPPLEIEGEQTLGFGDLLERARAAAPAVDISSVSLDRGGYFYAEGATDAVLVRDRANKMYLDPRDGRVVYSQAASDLSAYWQWSHMADPLHFGTFGGLTTKLIWFLFGLFLSGLSLTGGWLHLKRLEKAAEGRVRWRGTILAAWMALAIFAFCIVAAIYVGIGTTGVTIGTIAVSSGWSVLTFAICLIWLVALMRRKSSSHRDRPAAMQGVPK